MKAWLRGASTAAVLVLLAGGWAYLYTHSRTVDAHQQNATLALLKDLKQIDTDWGADVLRSQADLHKSYDALVRPLQLFATLTARLDEEAAAWEDAALRDALLDIKTTIAEKSDLIDRFKAQNSLLKNSLHYLPTAHRDIQLAMRTERDRGFSTTQRLLGTMPAETKRPQTPDADVSSAAVQADLAALRRRMDEQARQARAVNREAVALVQWENAVTQVVSEALRYYAVPDDAGGENLRRELEALRTSLPSYPAALQEPISNLVAHVEALLQLRSRQTALLRDIAAVPVPAKIDTLSNGLIARFDAELAQQGRYTGLLLFYSAAVLTLVFGAAGFIAYRNATERRRLAELVHRQTQELKDNEAQLIHAQKMNALGEMVAGITHEVNTPLAAVKSGLQSTREVMTTIAEVVDGAGQLSGALLQPTPKEEAQRRERNAALSARVRRLVELRDELASFQAIETVNQLLDDGIRSVEHISRVISNMLNFSRLDRSRIALSRVEDGLESTLAMAAHFLGKYTVVKEYGTTQPVHCDLAQINQVLLNLIRNAAQALPASGGTITLRTGMRSPDQVCIEVIDNGQGITPDVLPKIWQPFFTTKKEGAGTGLGLSTSKKIVEAHGGTIDVSTQVGVGTQFAIVLPVQPPAALYEQQDRLALASAGA